MSLIGGGIEGTVTGNYPVNIYHHGPNAGQQLFNMLPDQFQGPLKTILEGAKDLVEGSVPWIFNTETVVFHSSQRTSGTKQSGTIKIPRLSGSYTFVRPVTFACENNATSTPTTNDINKAGTGIMVKMQEPGLTRETSEVHSEKTKAQWFIPLTGAIDYERVTFVHKRWTPANMGVNGSTQNYSIEWAVTPANLSDTSWSLDWWMELEFAHMPWP